MREQIKEYYIQETELCVLLALKGKRSLYGICLDGAASMTQETLHHCLFAMQKKGIVSRWDSLSNAFLIEEGLETCMKVIQSADHFLVLADADEQKPEQYFYVAGRDAVMLQPAGDQGALHISMITTDELREYIAESGLVADQEQRAVPESVYEKVRGCWEQDKDTILQRPGVRMVLQEYNVHTQRRETQRIRFACGLDEYLVCGSKSEGGKES